MVTAQGLFVPRGDLRTADLPNEIEDRERRFDLHTGQLQFILHRWRFIQQAFTFLRDMVTQMIHDGGVPYRFPIILTGGKR
jgi:hypothetical protein